MFFNKKYPITMSMVTDHYEELSNIFYKSKPHKGAFVGVALLEGSFDVESPKEIFDSLEIGERLELFLDKDSKLSIPPIYVFRENQTRLGQLPISASFVPIMLLEKGINVWGHFEAKSFIGGLLSVAISIYCDKY